jgi:hypothetical protein
VQAQRVGEGIAPAHSQPRRQKGVGAGTTVTDMYCMLGVAEEYMLAAKDFRIVSLPDFFPNVRSFGYIKLIILLLLIWMFGLVIIVKEDRG